MCNNCNDKFSIKSSRPLFSLANFLSNANNHTHQKTLPVYYYHVAPHVAEHPVSDTLTVSVSSTSLLLNVLILRTTNYCLKTGVRFDLEFIKSSLPPFSFRITYSLLLYYFSMYHNSIPYFYPDKDKDQLELHFYEYHHNDFCFH